MNYYQVIARRGQLVTLREIGCETVPGSEGFMSETVRPVKDAFFAPPCAQCGRAEASSSHNEFCTHFEHAYVEGAPRTITKRVQFSGGEPFLSFEHGNGSLVKVVKFGNAETLVVGTHYRSWYA